MSMAHFAAGVTEPIVPRDHSWKFNRRVPPFLDSSTTISASDENFVQFEITNKETTLFGSVQTIPTNHPVSLVLLFSSATNRGSYFFAKKTMARFVDLNDSASVRPCCAR